MNEMVTIPREEYERLREAAEDLADIAAYDRVKADLAAGREELIPSEFVDRMLGGESPLRVYREFRGMTQSALSAAAGVNRVQIADIEAGRKSGSIDTVRKLAAALRVTIDDLV
ncbi:helix-turn-helix transcriptional regulator [Devosia sp.]|uniref:helix-turn-helix transcriptional regulator n=1 Tax=Devosia sp. TaxID=1871048 RepID=UPI002FC828F5